MGSLADWEGPFKNVGWFIPPFIQMGAISKLTGEILAGGQQYSQDDLERSLAQIYEANGLAAMVVSRYPNAPVIKEYWQTIAEAVEAHFFGLNHLAVGGLILILRAPDGSSLQRGLIKAKVRVGVRDVFAALADDCKQKSIARKWGKSDEVELDDGLIRILC